MTPEKCLQCAYHGWEFNGSGGCSRIPQAQDEKAHSRVSVKSYPLREEAGMIWIWADPDIPATDDPLPISSLMERFHRIGGTARGFMRDLPYGMEYLGENLADISHLPFSHHSVGSLNREDGCPVPLEMLTETQRLETAQSYNDNINKLPIFQSSVVDAAQHDPEIVAAWKSNPRVQANADPKLASSTLAFFDPCHIRYHRNPGQKGSSYEINLYMCPTTAGKSRVFLFTPFELQLPPVKKEGVDEDDRKKAEDMKGSNTAKKYEPSGIMKSAAKGLFGFRNKRQHVFPPYIGHMVAHSIFDGDGIFLHKQGDRMHRAGLSFKDYHTPTSSDIMVNAFRRWLEKAAGASDERAAKAVLGSSDAYSDQPQSDLLNRYTTHTIHCKICLDALKELQEKRSKLSLATTALVGATGASSILAALASVLLVAARLIRAQIKLGMPMFLASALAVVGSFVGAKRAMKEGQRLDKEIQRFYFEDYVHAEKD